MKMPAGVRVARVRNGEATIEFADHSVRGRFLSRLVQAGGGASIRKVTRPRVAYIVPVDVAHAAGLAVPHDADGGALTSPGIKRKGIRVEARPGETVELVGTDTGGPYEILPEIEDPGGSPLEPVSPKGYDDGLPDMDWSRQAINDYAAALTPPLDTTGERNKPSAIAAINEAVKSGAKRPE